MMKTKWQAVLEVMADGRFARVGACGHKHPSEKLAGQCAERWEQRIRNEEGLGESAKRYFVEAIAGSEGKQDPFAGIHPEEAPGHADGLIAEAESRMNDAAPDMLAALKVAAATIERLATNHGPFSSADGTMSAIAAAIAKAERGDK